MQAVPTYTCACSAHIANETKRGFERRIFKTSELILHPAASLVKAKGGRKKKVLLKEYSPRFLSSLPPFLATSDNCHSASIQKREELPYGISRKKRNRITEMAQYHSCTTRWHSLKGYTPETRLFASDSNSHTQDKTIARQARLPITASQGAREEHRGKRVTISLRTFILFSAEKKKLFRYIHNYIHLLLRIPLHPNKEKVISTFKFQPRPKPTTMPARFIYVQT